MQISIDVPTIAETVFAPQLNVERLPEAEHVVAWHIHHLLVELSRYERDFRYAAALFEQCYTRLKWLNEEAQNNRIQFDTMVVSSDTLIGWQKLSAREGALLIYHFGKSIEAIWSNLKATPTLESLIDIDALKTGSKWFKSSFPGFEAIRHVVSHKAEFGRSPEERSSHAVRGPRKFSLGPFVLEVRDKGAVTYFLENVFHNTYTVSLGGKVHGYEISQQTSEKLLFSKQQIYAAFDRPDILYPAARS